jgi:hypothetical protein
MKRNLIAAAVIAAAGMGAQTAYAINEAPDGRGEWAYVPYYTVNNSLNTEFSLINTSAHTLAVKVQFREGRYSRDVRDFHVYLSPYDMWSGTVTQGDNGGARVVSSDNSCTAPWLNDLGDGTRDVQFTEQLVTGTVQNSSLTAEGYIAITVMGASPSGIENVTDSVAYLAKHVNGVPRNCGAIVSTWGKAIAGGQGEPSDAISKQFGEPVNALAVTAKIVDPNSGNSTEVPTTMMGNYFNPLGVDGAALSSLGTNVVGVPFSELPNESTTSPAVANYMDGTGPRSISYTDGIDAFAGALMRTAVSNVYNTQGANTTEYVITFPVKAEYVAYDSSNTVVAVLPPYNPAPDSGVPLGAPQIANSYTDNEEWAGVSVCTTCDVEFSPPPPATVIPTSSLPNEVNVMRVNGSDALRSGLTVDATFADDNGNELEHGWSSTIFTDSVGLVGTDLDSGLSVMQDGFPVIGFSFERMNGNGVMDAIISNYQRSTL